MFPNKELTFSRMLYATCLQLENFEALSIPLFIIQI